MCFNHIVPVNAVISQSGRRYQIERKHSTVSRAVFLPINGSDSKISSFKLSEILYQLGPIGLLLYKCRVITRYQKLVTNIKS